jgi:nucleoside phosphorylase
MDRRQTHSADEPKLPLTLSEYYLLLLELATSRQTTVNVDRLRIPSNRFSDSQLWTRILLLLDQLGIAEDRGLDVAEGLASTLQSTSDTSSLPRSELESVLRRARQEDSGDTGVLLRYERKVLNLLRRSDTGWIDDTANPGTGDLGSQSRKSELWIDTKPIVRRWPREILETAEWNRIESPISGIQPLPIESTFVNLSLREVIGTTAKTLVDLETEALNELSFDRKGTGFTLEDVMLSLRGLTVIMGLPGAGKSTLIKWIARYVVTNEDCPFGIPVVINLRQFAREKAQDPTLSLMEHFFRSRGVTDSGQFARWRSLMAGLLDPADPSSNTAETFLWLFDGWDEVPIEMRDRILPEINSMSRYPGIITTRYSADPMHLPARRFFELRGLKFGAALDLAHRWLKHAGREEYYGGIETLLMENPDLRLLSRNPFLLTLLCALYSESGGHGSNSLPRRRGDIIEKTLKLVYDQHNADPKQPVKFHSKDRQRIKKFAFWLVSEAPNSPRFVFDHWDYEQCTGIVGSFESLLVPSRLVAVPSADRDDFQFLHASFQEHLAAEHLVANPDQIPKSADLAFNQEWKEIIRLLAESAEPGTKSWQALWREARDAEKLFDKFGIVASRLAFWVAATGATDGGRELIGVDLRDVLWRIAARHATEVPKPLIEALVELDAPDFARRILDRRIAAGQNSTVTSWLELVSIFDLEMLFTDHEKYRRVLALPEVATFCPELPDLIRRESSADDTPEAVALRKIESAVRSRNLKAALEGFWSAVNDGLFEVASEAIQLFDHFPPDEVALPLRQIATAQGIDEMTQGAAVRQLVLSGNKKERQRLMLFLSEIPTDSPSALAILGNLQGVGLDRYQNRIVEEFFTSSTDPETRMAAAELMSFSRSRSTSVALMNAFSAETDAQVRTTILRVLADLAEESEIERLWTLKEGRSLKSSIEWGLWLRAFLLTLQERILRVNAADEWSIEAETRQQIRDWEAEIRQLLQKRKGATRQELLLAAFEFPQRLGSGAVDELIRAIEDRQLSEEARTMAIVGLGKLGGPQAIEYLASMVTKTGDDNSPEQQRAACDTLGELSARTLARIGGAESEKTMARLAFRHEILFHNRTVLNSDQASSKPGRRAKTASSVEWPIRADIGVFLALTEEFDSFRDLLRRRGSLVWEPFDDPGKAFTYYRTQVKAPGMQEPVSIVAVCASEMGPGRAGILASAFTSNCITKSVVVIGIAGSFDSELRLGDVLVPSEAYSYLENSSAENSEDTWKFNPSGRHFTANAHLLNQARQLERKYPELQKSWEARCKQRLTRMLGKEQAAKALGKNLTRSKPQVLAADHHLATGPAVGKSSAFSKWIQSHNRKAVAMEMETAAVFEAVEVEIKPQRRLAIRGISDFADKRKSKVEKDYRGKFRGVSHLNACDYFFTLIEGGVFTEPPDLDQNRGTTSKVP